MVVGEISILGSWISKPSDSTIWKSLCSVKDIFKAGFSISEEDESMRWNLSASGEYSVKTVMILHSNGNCQRRVGWEKHPIMWKEMKDG